MSQKRFATILLILGDIIMLYAALGTTLLIRYGTDLAEPWEVHRMPYAIVIGLWILLFFIAGLYEQTAWNANRMVKERMLRTIIIAGAIAGLLFYFIPAFVITPKTNLILHIVFSSGLLIAWRMAASILIRSTSKTNVLFFDSKNL